MKQKKISAVKLILSVDNEDIINHINANIIQFIPKNEQEALAAKYAGRIESTLDLEQIKKEQNFNGIDPVKMDKLIAEADINESLDQLLEMMN